MLLKFKILPTIQTIDHNHSYIKHLNLYVVITINFHIDLIFFLNAMKKRFSEIKFKTI
jgi:hypothetical protein